TTTWAISGTSSKLQIESGGTLTANNAVTLATATNFRIDNGGTYIHNYATAASSTIFAGTESFAALSNIRLDNWVNNTTSITTGVTLPYGNLEINYSANASNWQQGISGTITLCAGNLTITSVGTGTIRFSAGTAPTITVGGNYTQAAGTVNMASTAGSSVCVLNVAGNFAVNGGSFTSTSTGSKVVFNGSGTQNFTNAGTISTVNFEVGSSSSLNMGTQVLTGGSFALPAGATLKTANTGGIDGSITVTGAKTLNAAANYVFNGSLAQVTGTSLTATVNNLTVDNASGLTLSNTALTVNGTLLINSGMKLEIGPGKQLTVAGTLTNSAGNTGLVLKSDATGAGSLIHNTADVPATIERYISGAAIPGVGSATAYHFVSVPLTSGGTSNQFAGSYLYDFNESRDLWNSLGASTSTALYNSRGYLIYYPSDNITYPFSGNMNNGSFTPLTTFTTDDDTVKGYNLVPNPYPSAINWTAASGWTKTNVENKVWIWNNGSYATYNAAGPDSTSGGKRFIPVGQAFFVHADGLGAPVLTMDNPVRTHLTNAFLKDAVVPISYRLSLVASMGESSDEIVVKFNDEASMEKDMYDMNKIPGDQFTPQLSSLNPAGERLSINALPFSEGDVVVPLEFKLNAATEVTFTASGLESFYMGIPIYLEDRAMNKVIDLHTNPVYTFTHSTLSAGNRFQLRFLGVTATPVQPEVTPGSAFVSQGKLFVDVPSMAQSAAVISVYDALGRQLSSRKTVLNGVMQLPAPVVPGVYVVRVMSGDKTFTAKVVVK
ncbi:MAG: T9SS type A sorting domain-containing protein, partial [Bacteroidota bacterium]